MGWDANMTMTIIFRVFAAVCTAGLLAGCVAAVGDGPPGPNNTRGPGSLGAGAEPDLAVGGLYEWYVDTDALVGVTAEARNAAISCMPYPSAEDSSGQFVGCQRNEIYDVRSPILWDAMETFLQRVGCQGSVTAAEDQVYLVNQRPFLFFDRANRTAWFVPGEFPSDGATVPSDLRRFLRGSTWDTSSPKTFPAAMVHDRYFCLRNYTEQSGAGGADPSPWASDEIAYRRRGCANDAFNNALATSGLGDRAGNVMTAAVKLANPGVRGYCPLGQADDVMIVNDILEDFYGAAPRRDDFFPDCEAFEPAILCLSIKENLETAANSRRTPRVWRALMAQMLELDASGSDSWATANAEAASPFRAGDLWIEGSGYLAANGPEALLRLLQTGDIDDAVYRLMTWNEAAYEDRGRESFGPRR